MVFKPKQKAAKPETIKEETIKSDSPIHKAFYIEKENGSWNLVIADIQDDKIISKKVKVCDNKALSLENFKIRFAETYYFGQ